MRVVLDGVDEIDAFVNHWKPSAAPLSIVRFTYHVKRSDGSTFTCQELTMLDLTVGKMSTVTMGPPTDQYGNAAALDGGYTFENTTPQLATITPNADNTGFDIVAGTVANQVVLVNVSADVDLGAGVKTHTEPLSIALKAGEATTFNATMGPETDPPVA